MRSWMAYGEPRFAVITNFDSAYEIGFQCAARLKGVKLASVDGKHGNAPDLWRLTQAMRTLDGLCEQICNNQLQLEKGVYKKDVER